MRNLIIIILTWFAVGNLQSQVLIDKVVAVVGDRIILKSDIEVQYNQYRQQGKPPVDLRCQIMDQLLANKLLVAQAELDSIEVSENDVEAELDKRIRHFISLIGSQEKLEEYYQKSVYEIKDEFRDDVLEQMLAQRMKGRITADLSITPVEVKKFFDNIPKDSLPYYNAEVEVGQIVVMAEPSQLEYDAALKKLEGIREEIANGASLKLKAILYSMDPGSAAKGGELPEFTRDDPYAPEFIGAAFRLKDGEVSEPFRTEFGFHIIEMIKRTGNRVLVRHILITPEISQSDMEIAKENIDSVRNLILRDDISFPKAVARYSDDEMTKNYAGFFANPQTGETFIEIEQLGAADREIPFIIDSLEPGQFSLVIEYNNRRGKPGYRFLYLRSFRKPHIADYETDYAKIQTVALLEKQDKVLVKWMKEKIRKTFIKIDNTYRDCEHLEMWFESTP
jgi:peptidyl-prolyl cis-trans isomerase SurA